MQIFVCKHPFLLLGRCSKAGEPKQRLNIGNTDTKWLHNAVRIMKITVVLLLAACLQVSATGFSQKVTLDEEGAKLETILKKIEKTTRYKFLYMSQLLESSGKISISVRNADIQHVLDLCFKGQKFSYEINGNTIVIRPQHDDIEKKQAFVKAAASIDLRGKVVDENENPVPGVTVTVKGTNKQTTTNELGEFSLKDIDDNAVISFSSVNMEPFTINVGGKSELIAKLKTKTNQLDEVQIIAYGQTTKRFQTGNVNTIKGNEVDMQPVTNPLLALQGRVPGLFITQSTGLPGSGVTVRVQGQNSINKGNDPLYVIDGVPFTSQLLPNLANILGVSAGYGQANGNPLNYINTADIESIEVLKDGGATAIYGSRAANGAILITTKKGKAGKTGVNVNVQNGWGKLTRKLELLNTSDYLQMRLEAKKNDGAPILPWDNDIRDWDSTKYTDWQKELLGGAARYLDINGNISGGSSLVQYLVGMSFHRETTVFPGDMSDKRASVHFNLNSRSSNEKFKFQLSSNYLWDYNRLMGTDLTWHAMSLAPNAPSLRNDDGSLNWAPDASGNTTWGDNGNPLAYLNNKYKNRTTNLISNAVLSYDILKDLSINASLGYTNTQTDEIVIVPLTVSPPEWRPFIKRTSQFGANNINSWIIEPQMKYRRSFGGSRFDFLVGATVQQSNFSRRQANATGFFSDDVMEDIKSATTLTVPDGGTISSEYKYNAAFFRINYNLRNKYLVDLTARRDGSSRFGSKNQFHNFWSVGGAWIFTEEKFIKNNLPFVSFGKFKGSYGTTGNDQIGDYQYLEQYVSFNPGVPYQGTLGLQPIGISNPYLAWEETKKLYFGVTLGLLKERLLLDVGYARNHSSNQLLNYTLPIITGVDGITRNFPAEIENVSWEFSLNGTILKGTNFKWSSSINLTLPTNELKEFENLTGSPYARDYKIGMPITSKMVHHFLGVDPATGAYRITNTLDERVPVNTAPKYYGGFQNSLSFKSFELNVLLQFCKQIGANYFFANYPGISNANQPTWVLDRWQKTGDITNVQRYNSDFSLDYPSSLLIDAGYSDASFVRCKNIMLSWTLPYLWRNKAHLTNARIYVQGQNLFTITNYKGLDPETKTSRRLPPLTVMTFGISLGL